MLWKAITLTQLVLLTAASALAQSPVISTVAGGGPNNIAATSARVDPIGVAMDQAGNLYVSVEIPGRVYKIAPNGMLTVLAGTGTLGFEGDGGNPLNASFGVIAGLATDSNGNIYIADSSNNRIRRITAGPNPIITTVAGKGTIVDSGDGGNPIDAGLFSPRGVAVDANGNLYIADSLHHRIRKVTFGSTPTITGVVGIGGASGFGGDGGDPLAARLSSPESLAFDSSGNLYIADTGNSRVRKVTFGSTPTITTVAGTGIAGFSGDGGHPASADLSNPRAVAIDAAGNLFIGDTGNRRIRKVTFGTTPVIDTVVANGNDISSGDGGPPLLASIKPPTALVFDISGNLYIAERDGAVVRKVTFGANAVITTVAGIGSITQPAEGINPLDAYLEGLETVAVDGLGNLYLSDFHRIRKGDGDLQTNIPVSSNAVSIRMKNR